MYKIICHGFYNSQLDLHFRGINIVGAYTKTPRSHHILMEECMEFRLSSMFNYFFIISRLMCPGQLSQITPLEVESELQTRSFTLFGMSNR